MYGHTVAKVANRIAGSHAELALLPCAVCTPAARQCRSRGLLRHHVPPPVSPRYSEFIVSCPQQVKTGIGRSNFTMAWMLPKNDEGLKHEAPGLYNIGFRRPSRDEPALRVPVNVSGDDIGADTGPFVDLVLTEGDLGKKGAHPGRVAKLVAKFLQENEHEDEAPPDKVHEKLAARVEELVAKYCEWRNDLQLRDRHEMDFGVMGFGLPGYD